MPAHVPNAGLSRRDLLKRTGGLAALAALTAACGGNTGRPSGGGGEGGGAKATLSQWYHQYGEAGTKEAALKYAKAYTDANVSVQWTPGDYGSKLSAGLLSNKGPDVFESQLNIGMVKGNQVVPLDDIIADVKDDFQPGDLATNTVDGKIYGIRMIVDPQVIYYKKSLLDKAGIKPPETVDDLIAAAKELTTNKVKGIFVGNDGGLAMGGPALWSSGGSYLTEDNKPGFTGDRAAQAFSKLHQLYAEQERAARCADGLVGSECDQPGPGRDAVDRHVGGAGDAEGARRRHRRDPVPEAGRLGPAGGVLRRLDPVRLGEEPEHRRGEEARQVAVDREGGLPGGLVAELRLPHPAAEEPRRQGGQAAERRRRRDRQAHPGLRPHRQPGVDAEDGYGVR